MTFPNYLTVAGLPQYSQVYPANDYYVVDIGDNVRADLAGATRGSISAR